MAARGLVAALRNLFHRQPGPAPLTGLPLAPPVPTPIDPPPGWRSFQARTGPYLRFSVAFPRDWEAIPSKGGEILRLQPGGEAAAQREAMARTPLSLEHLLRPSPGLHLTLSHHPIPVPGPQALFEVLAELAQGRGLSLDRGDVALDRWGEDAWAGSWSWVERRKDAPAESAWTFALGHDQGVVLALSQGPRDVLATARAELSTLLGTLRLNRAELLAPEFFAHAVRDLLNDRHGPGTADRPQPWSTDRDGTLLDGHHSVQLADLYRAYLLHGDLDLIATTIEALPAEDGAAPWIGRSVDELLPQLRVVLRRPEQLGRLPVLHLPLTSEFVACPVLDSPDRLTFIPEREAERWGLDPLALVERAVARLDDQNALSVEEVRDEEDQELLGVRLAADDAYDSGRLLCPGLRRDLGAILGDPLLVAMPAAERIWVFRDTPTARALLRGTAARDFERRPRPLSKTLWLWSEGGLEPVP